MRWRGPASLLRTPQCREPSGPAAGEAPKRHDAGGPGVDVASGDADPRFAGPRYRCRGLRYSTVPKLAVTPVRVVVVRRLVDLNAARRSSPSSAVLRLDPVCDGRRSVPCRPRRHGSFTGGLAHRLLSTAATGHRRRARTRGADASHGRSPAATEAHFS